MGVWLLWSGHYTALIITFGALSCLLVVLIASRMGIADAEGHPIGMLVRIVAYVPWLTWAIIRSNIDIAAVILKPGLPISPRVFKIKAGQKSTVGKVIYANSITLTPGTVALDVDGDIITVHALDEGSARDLEEGSMDRRVCRVEGSAG
jgi:multicomponent Na+:H+ antiporter subunit E